MQFKNKYWFFTGAATVILDQAAKMLVLNNLSLTDCIHIIPGVIDFVFVKNTGAAFSIFSEHTAVLGIISVIFCIALGVYWYVAKPVHILKQTALTLLFAGALGNAIDRIFRGYVIDFISTVFITFPVFNVADIAITVGAALLVIYMLFYEGGRES